MNAWKVVVGLLAGVFVAGSAAADQSYQVNPDALQEAFYETLSDQQIVTFLKAVDDIGQRTERELGAKYRWGDIPPDRTPPRSLGRWWSSRSQRQRRQQRLDWFDEHAEQVSVDRVAQVLGLQGRLARIHRSLQDGQEPSQSGLEPVALPSGPATPESTPNPTRVLGAVHDQNPSDENDREQGQKVEQSSNEHKGTDPSEEHDTQPDDTEKQAGGPKTANQASRSESEHSVKKQTPQQKDDHKADHLSSDETAAKDPLEPRSNNTSIQPPTLRRKGPATSPPDLRRAGS